MEWGLAGNTEILSCYQARLESFCISACPQFLGDEPTAVCPLASLPFSCRHLLPTKALPRPAHTWRTRRTRGASCPIDVSAPADRGVRAGRKQARPEHCFCEDPYKVPVPGLAGLEKTM